MDKLLKHTQNKIVTLLEKTTCENENGKTDLKSQLEITQNSLEDLKREFYKNNNSLEEEVIKIKKEKNQIQNLLNQKNQEIEQWKEECNKIAIKLGIIIIENKEKTEIINELEHNLLQFGSEKKELIKKIQEYENQFVIMNNNIENNKCEITKKKDNENEKTSNMEILQEYQKNKNILMDTCFQLEEKRKDLLKAQETIVELKQLQNQQQKNMEKEIHNLRKEIKNVYIERDKLFSMVYEKEKKEADESTNIEIIKTYVQIKENLNNNKYVQTFFENKEESDQCKWIQYHQQETTNLKKEMMEFHAKKRYYDQLQYQFNILLEMYGELLEKNNSRKSVYFWL